MKTDTTPTPGETLHWVETGMSYVTDLDVPTSGRISTRGEQFTVTDALLRATSDRHGASFLALADDEHAQIKRWGKVMFRRGPAPTGRDEIRPWTPGSAEEDEARTAARDAANSMPFGPERDAALREVRRIFGVQKTSKTTMVFKSDPQAVYYD